MFYCLFSCGCTGGRSVWVSLVFHVARSLIIITVNIVHYWFYLLNEIYLFFLKSFLGLSTCPNLGQFLSKLGTHLSAYSLFQCTWGITPYSTTSSSLFSTLILLEHIFNYLLQKGYLEVNSLSLWMSENVSISFSHLIDNFTNNRILSSKSFSLIILEALLHCSLVSSSLMRNFMSVNLVILFSLSESFRSLFPWLWNFMIVISVWIFSSLHGPFLSHTFLQL